jgi:hypothetical protein
MKHNPGRIVAAFIRAAPTVLDPIMTVNSCIGSTRITVDCLAQWGVSARPQAVKWAVQFPARQLAYVAGLTAEERATAKQSIHHDWGGHGHWEGHLVAIAGDYLIDPSFHQAFIALGLAPECRIFAARLGEPVNGSSWSAEMKAVLDSGEKLKLHYVCADNPTWESSNAWLDEQVPFIARAISEKMAHILGYRAL